MTGPLDEALTRAGIPERRRRRAHAAGGRGALGRSTRARSGPWWVWMLAALAVAAIGTALTVLAWRRAGASLGSAGHASVLDLAGLLALAGVATGVSSWLGGIASRELSATVRRRQIRGLVAARGLDADTLGRSLDIEQFEQVAVGVLAIAAVGLAESVAAIWIIARLAPARAAILVGATVVVAAAGAAMLARRSARAADARSELTSRIVERVGGFRSYSIYGDAAADARDDHALLDRYGRAILASDIGRVLVGSVLPRLMLIAGVVLLVDSGASPTRRGALIGALLLLSLGIEQITAALAQAAANLPAVRSALPLIRSHREPPVAEDDTLGARIGPGEHVFLVGPTASGKTTAMRAMAAAAAGRATLVSHARPEDTLHQAIGFNLSAGTGWPSTREDDERLRSLLRRYRLDKLVASMPQGLAQPVGETGWRLSHGEHARLGLVRALASNPDVVLVDGTLEALDPQTRLEILDELASEPRTVVVSAWPEASPHAEPADTYTTSVWLALGTLTALRLRRRARRRDR